MGTKGCSNKKGEKSYNNIIADNESFSFVYQFTPLRNKLLCHVFRALKGQVISKAIYGLLTSPKKQTDEFVLFAFLLFRANKSNTSIRFLGESTARQSAFRFYLTFSHTIQKSQNMNRATCGANSFICGATDYGRLVRKSPSLHGRKSTPLPNF